jgi:DNA-binding NtrC family response regulator
MPSDLIQRAPQRCEGSLGKTADVLGIGRKTLWERGRSWPSRPDKTERYAAATAGQDNR